MKSGWRLLAVVGLAGLGLVACGKSGSSMAAGKSRLFASAPPEVKEKWDIAAAAAGTNDFALAMLSLQQLQALTNLTAEQRQAVGQTATAISDQMYEAANKGDANAQKAIDDLRKLRLR